MEQRTLQKLAFESEIVELIRTSNSRIDVFDVRDSRDRKLCLLKTSGIGGLDRFCWMSDILLQSYRTEK